MHGYPIKRLLLFLTVLILPTLAIVAQGVMIDRMDREIARSRARERERDLGRRVAAEVGQETFAILERIKGQEVANAGGLIIPQPGTYSDPAVAIVGRINGKELMWPWERSDHFGIAHQARMKDPPFARMVENARRAELVDKDLRRAADLYRDLISASRTNGQLAYAQLGLGRVLRQTGNAAEAVAVYGRVLNDSSDNIDENKVSFASLAASELTHMRAAGMRVLERVQQDLESRAAMWPIQTERWRAVLEELERADDSSVRERAKALRELLLKRAADLEHARNRPEFRKLQEDFPKLPPATATTPWQPYAASNGELWLIGRTAGRLPIMSSGSAIRFSPDGRFISFLAQSVTPLVVVVSADAVRRTVESNRASNGSSPRFAFNMNGEGEPIWESAGGLHITFPDFGADAAGGLGLRHSFYAWSILFVVPLTFVGGYLVWRDTRREVRVADMRSHFVSSVSHELKTPLTSIRMFAEALQMKYSADPQLREEYLDTIVKESERLTRLLNNVLDFSKIDRGQKGYRAQPTQLADVVRAAARTMQYPLEQQGFALTVNVDDRIPPVAIDRDAIQQAILNLLTNAMKYSGGSRDIALELLADGNSAVIRVSDHGIGIPVAEQTRIFEPFYRSPIPENAAVAGMGLGLALVAHAAAAHGGTVDVQSGPGRGSTFSLRLPLNVRAGV